MKPKKVVFLDLWKTLVTSHCREPVWNLQRAIGHNVFTPEGGQEIFEPDDDFLRWCLTTPILDRDEFVQEAARRFGQTPTARALKEFERILQGEVGCVARFEDVDRTLAKLEDRGHTLACISNLWPFPAERIFEVNGLGRFIPRANRVYSFEERHRKPEPEIYLAACRRLGVRPEDAIMVGDNLEADVIGALKIGMHAALIDRPGEISEEAVPEGVPILRELDEIVTILEKEERS